MRAKRVDVNQREIVQALRTFGAVVHDLSGVGQGCPDLLVGYRGKTVLVEVKRDSKAKYTPAQMAWNEAWRGGLVARIESIDDAIALLNAD
jgi:hypothetical protein